MRIIILFFLDRPHCAWSVLPRSWAGFLPAEISYLVIKRHIPSPYIHIPETCLSVNHCVFVYVMLTLLVLQMNLICMCSFLFCENVQRLKNKLKEMSSSQEDLSKMSVKVLNLPFVIMFAKLYQSQKESSLSPEKKNRNNNNNNNISWLKFVSNPWLSFLHSHFAIFLFAMQHN